MKKDENILEIINLKKYYGKIRGVEDVTIKLKKGEVIECDQCGVMLYLK